MLYVNVKTKAWWESERKICAYYMGVRKFRPFIYFLFKRGGLSYTPPPLRYKLRQKENVFNESFVFVILSCLFIAALWSPAEKWLTSWLAGGILYTMIFWNYTIYKAKWHMLALWQLGHYCVTALLTTLPYNSFQSTWANTNLYLNLINQHANDLKITKLNAANSWYASIQLKSIILQLYT